MVHCTPHAGLGTVVVRQVQIDLATCLTAKAQPLPASMATLRGNSILFKGRVVLTVPRSKGLVELEGVSPDGTWILYALDPMGSASLAADGLTVEAVAATGGRSYTVTSGLTYPSYRSWCDFRTLVVTAGGDRISSHDKRLIATGPPAWRPRALVHEPGRAFGSVVCAPDGNSVVVQEEPRGGVDESSVRSHWQLWRIGLDGKPTELTSPPPGYSDDSPQFSPDQRTVYFVRSKNDHGVLYALRDGKLVGPLLDLGLDRNAYYGHRDWPYRVTR